MNIWVVGRVHGDVWEYQGVFDSEEKAKEACKIDYYWAYFIGPTKLNEEVTHDSIEWPGAYYPYDAV